MTREEAKRRLLDIERCTPIHTREDVRDFEALEMAIQALSQEPTDAISLTKEAYSDLCLRASKADDLQRALDMEKGAYNALVKNIQCDDVVSREAVIDAIERVRNNHAYDEIEEIQKLPSVTQKSGKWIGYSDENAREGAIEKLESMRQKVDEETYKALILAIKALEQEPKTGHWIMSDDGLYRPICDKCGAHPWKGYIPTVEEATEVFKYCPNCGARMVEPQERSNKE